MNFVFLIKFLLYSEFLYFLFNFLLIGFSINMVTYLVFKVLSHFFLGL